MNQNPKDYRGFVFFSAGPVGDHALILDFANRFYESTGKPSYIISKHPSAFLSDLVIPYTDHVHELQAKGWRGMIATGMFVVKTIFIPHCYILVLPIPHPAYLVWFARLIRFCTRSRFVGLTSPCGYLMPGGPRESATFLGKGNYIPAHVDTKLFYEQANMLLEWLGYQKIPRGPELEYIPDDAIFEKLGLNKKEYIVSHLVASTLDKSFSPTRWNTILGAVMAEFPDTKFVFSGAKNDWEFIDKALGDLPRTNVVNICGKVSMQELLNIYAEARLTVSVHTGNAIILNMLHVPTVMINMKGVYMFKYMYNEHMTELTSTLGCTCNPYERHCTMIEDEGVPYMACIWNIQDDDVIRTIIQKCESLQPKSL